MRHGPPRAARWLLRRCAPLEEREYLVGDLDEEFAEMVGSHGRTRARRWYWGQVFSSAAPLAGLRLRGGAMARRDRIARGGGTGDDVRFALRLARRNALPSLTVVVTIALGIAATTAVFSVVEGVLLRPLPVPQPGQVVRFHLALRDGRLGSSVAYPDLQDYKAQTTSFEAIAGVNPGQMVYAGGESAEFVSSLAVEEGFDRIFALRPAMGRWLTSDEFRDQREDVILVSHAFWTARLGADPAVLGRTITLDGTPRTVVGVLPPERFLSPTPDVDVVLPLYVARDSFRRNRGAVWLSAVGRIRTGVSLEQAASDLAAVGARISRDFPDAMSGISPRLERLLDALVGPVRPMLLLLSGAVVLVLLVASANVASLLLALAGARRRELAVRLALGGNPWRVRRQLLIESGTLAGCGGVIGMAVSPAATRALLALYPGGLPRANEVRLDPVVMGVSMAAIALAALLAWLPAARRLARADLRNDLGSGGRGMSERRRLGAVTVAAQIAISAILVFAAGVLLRAHQSLSRIDPGFRAEGTLTFELSAGPVRYPAPAQVEAFFGEVVRRIGALPGVHDVAEASYVPFGPCCWGDVFVREDLGDRGTNNPSASVRWISPNYFRLLGMRFLEGETLTDPTAGRSVVINETLARQAFPDGDPLGKTIQWNGLSGWRVAGVVADTRERHWLPPMAELYVPVGWRRGRYLLVRHDGPAGALLGAIRETVRGVDPLIVVDDPATLEARMTDALASHRFRAALVGVLGGITLFLAGVGVFGLIAQAVGRRTREIGIRMALGASGREVGRRVVWDALRVAGAGLAAGAVGALMARRGLAAFVEGVPPNDSAVLGATILALLTVTCAAALVPARRASRVDPIVTLRSE